MKVSPLLFSLLMITFAACKKDKSPDPFPNPEIAVDADGNTYNTIVVGNQTWMLQNLKTTKYNDGTPITQYTQGTHGVNWLNLNTPEALYQWAETSDLNNVHANELPFDYYGAMYNHLAIESGKLAPTGWRIPTIQDFKILESHLSANGYAGKEGQTLKSSNGWLISTGSGTDAIGFGGLPNGYVSAFGTPTLAEGITTWATTNTNVGTAMRTMIQLFDQDTILFAENPIQIGAGIRCIKN